MDALLLIDIQKDFCPGGALPVRDGDLIVPVANQLQKSFDVVIATQDWHPAEHGSFAANHEGREPGEVIELRGISQVLWPVHCVQGTPGAEFVSALDTERLARVFRKGTDPDIDSYSGFFDNDHRKSTGLGDYLAKLRVTAVYIIGLATDYCVMYTALDAVSLGLNTHIVEDACRGVNLTPGDVDRAVANARAAGVSILQSADVLRRRREGGRGP